MGWWTSRSKLGWLSWTECPSWLPPAGSGPEGLTPVGAGPGWLSGTGGLTWLVEPIGAGAEAA